jgi:hypothetical protein
MYVVYINTGPYDLDSGSTLRIAINAPLRGTILKAQVIETTGGTKNAFTYAFFNSAAACPPGLNGVVDPVVEYNGQIGPVRSVPGNQDRYLLADGSEGGFVPLGPYANNDVGLVIPTGQLYTGQLYIKIVSTGTGPNTFGIYLGIQID